MSDNSYLWAWKLERNETLHIRVQHGKSLQHVQSWSHRRRQRSGMWRMLGQKVRSTRHNAVRHDGQLVTPFYGVTSWLVPSYTGYTAGAWFIRTFSWNIRRHAVNCKSYFQWRVHWNFVCWSLFSVNGFTENAEAIFYFQWRVHETMSTEIYFQWMVHWIIGHWNLFSVNSFDENKVKKLK